MATVIQTPRLRLRHLCSDERDAAAMLELLNTADFHRYIGDRGVRSLQQARDYIAAGPMASYAAHGYGMYALERRDDGAWLGNVGLVSRAALPCTDIGYALLQRFAGHGYAYEAAAALLVHAQQVLKLPRVCAIVDPRNIRSIALLHKLGLREQGGIVLPDTTRMLLLFDKALTD